MTRNITTIAFDWQGIALPVTYESKWLDSESANVAHLQIECVSRVRLPITETGYLSHFVEAEEIEQAGGPVPYVTEWLDYMARSNEWNDYIERSRQLTLF